MTNDQTDLTASLDAILDEERAALIDGNLDALAELFDRKMALVDALHEADSGAAALVLPLRVKIDRNQALLDNALEGIRTVADRLAEVRRVRTVLDTYDRAGQKKSYPATARGQIEKRA